MKLNVALMVCTIMVLNGCKTENKKELKLNNIQVIGSHNSYKQAIELPLMALIEQETSKSFKQYQYTHESITSQLNDFGLRNLEIDVLFDPNGGKFAKPYGLELLKQQGVPTKPFDTLGIMNKKGFKVLHIPDIDFRTSCMLLVDCLQEIKDWSDAHSNHLPIAVTFNAKSESIDIEGFQKLLPFTSEVFDAFEDEVLSVLPKEKLIVPDDVRGNFKTLEEAVLAHNWPTLKASRGKIILVLDEGGEKRKAFIEGHPSLKGRLLFTKSDPGTPEAAFLIMNDPIKHQDSIKSLVKAGYLVRTRADADTYEARNNDYSRFKAALSSGAHFISTDYYWADPSLNNDYKIELPNKKVARCNPIFSLEECVDNSLE